MNQDKIEEKTLELILLIRMRLENELTEKVYTEKLKDYFKQDLSWKELFDYIINGNHEDFRNKNNIFVNKAVIAEAFFNNIDPFTLFDVNQKIKDIEQSGICFDLMKNYSWMLQNKKIISLFSPEEKGNFLNIALYYNCIRVIKAIIIDDNWKGDINLNHMIKGISDSTSTYLLSNWMSDNVAKHLSLKDKDIYNKFMLLIHYFNFKEKTQLKMLLDSDMINNSGEKEIDIKEIDLQIEMSKKEIKKYQKFIYWEDWEQNIKDNFIRNFSTERKIEHSTLKELIIIREKLEPLFSAKRLENILDSKEQNNLTKMKL